MTKQQLSSWRSTRTFSNLTWKLGRSLQTARWFQASNVTTYEFCPRALTIPIPMKIPTAAGLLLLTVLLVLNGSSPPRRLSMRAFWSWSATGSGSRMTRSSWIPYEWWTPCSRLIPHSALAGTDTVTTGMDNVKTAVLLLQVVRAAAGHDVKPFIRAMEGFGSATGLLPEQVWDEPDRPDIYMYLGRPTGSAMPLMWAHAEYIKLLRSVADGQAFDLIPEVAERYLSGRNTRQLFEVWKRNRQVRGIRKGSTLRIQVDTP